MAALSVALNGKFLVSVGTEGLDIVDVGVHGDRLGPEPANLGVRGGSYPEGGQSRYFIWEDERPLQPGDTISVTFSQEGNSSRPGQTVEELYPEEAPTPPQPFPSVDEVLKELTQRPKQFDHLSFRLVAPNSAITEGGTAVDEHGFAFSVLWNSHRSGSARVSLHTYSLEYLAKRREANYHADMRLQYGQGVTFVVAPNPTVDTDARKSGARGSP
jgi:hypothetical protein